MMERTGLKKKESGRGKHIHHIRDLGVDPL